MQRDSFSFYLDKAIIVDKPFRHFFVETFLSQAVISDFLDWFENDAPWMRQKFDGLYDIQKIDLNEALMPTTIDFIKRPDFLKKLHNFVELIFSTRLSEHTIIRAHKMTSCGEKINIHTDHQVKKKHFRVIIPIVKMPAQNHGGVLIFFDKNKKTQLSRKNAYYPPVSGSCIGFEVSEKSFHAVTPVIYGERYSICFLLEGNC